MEQGKPEKSFWRKLIKGLAVAGAVLPALWFLSWLATPRLQKYVKKSRESAAQSLLQQLALGQMAHQADTERYATDWNSLYEYGFRLDPNVRVLVVVIDLNWGTGQLQGFMARANHAADKSPVYVYDNISGAGVRAVPELKRLGAEYAPTVVEEDGPANGQPPRLAGPPFLIIRIPTGQVRRGHTIKWDLDENHYGAK